MPSGPLADGDRDNIEEYECVRYSLSVIDLFTSRVFAIDDVGDLCAFGELLDLYALDEHILILVYHKHIHLLKQRVIYVDVSARRAQYLMQRTYSMRFDDDDDYGYQLYRGTNLAVVAPVNMVGERAYTFPMDPRSPTDHKGITDLARAHAQHHVPQRSYEIVELFSLFIITDMAIGFFLQRIDHHEDFIDLTFALMLDLSNGSCYLQDVITPNKYGYWTETYEWTYFSTQDDDRSMILRVDGFFFFKAILNTRLLTWTELEIDADEDEICYPMSTRGGTFFQMRVPSLARLAAIEVQKGGHGLSEMQLQQIGERFV